MLYLGNTPLAGRLQTRMFTYSGSWTVPADVSAIWVDGCGAGGGGGGGNTTPGGGGGGGGPGMAVRGMLLPVVPGETLTVTVGGGGTKGAAGGDGSVGGSSSLAGSVSFTLAGGVGGGAGANPNGGTGGVLPNGTGNHGGGAGAGASLTYKPYADKSYYLPAECWTHGYCAGGAGGALNNAGGAVFGNTFHTTARYAAGGTGGASGGGGGAGGLGPFQSGAPVSGGSNGAAGSNAPNYGCGGSGGSGNAAGGDGSGGFIRLYCVSAYTI